MRTETRPPQPQPSRVLSRAERSALLRQLRPMWERADVAKALAAHDITTIYRTINRTCGISQRTLAALVGQPQSEISAIANGRQVTSYAVLLRIATALDIPRWRMGLCAEAPTAHGRHSGTTRTRRRPPTPSTSDQP